ALSGEVVVLDATTEGEGPLGPFLRTGSSAALIPLGRPGAIRGVVVVISLDPNRALDADAAAIVRRLTVPLAGSSSRRRRPDGVEPSERVPRRLNMDTLVGVKILRSFALLGAGVALVGGALAAGTISGAQGSETATTTTSTTARTTTSAAPTAAQTNLIAEG